MPFKGVRLIVYASVNANPLKVERMRDLGAEVRRYGDDFNAAKIEAKRVAQRQGIRMVEDSLDAATAEGAGTIGLELLQWPEPLDAVLVALGNGALVNGVGWWVKANAPATAVVAVATAGAPTMVESWQTGTIVEYPRVNTIADGIAVRVPIPEAVTDMRGTVDDALLVRDETILTGMRLLHQHLGLVVEPSAAIGVAALEESGPVQGPDSGNGSLWRELDSAASQGVVVLDWHAGAATGAMRLPGHNREAGV